MTDRRGVECDSALNQRQRLETGAVAGRQEPAEGRVGGRKRGRGGYGTPQSDFSLSCRARSRAVA